MVPKILAVLVAALALLPVPPARAEVHLMKIAEVFAGVAAAPQAQYVELQMHALGQNFTNGAWIEVFDSANASQGTFTFTENQANGNNQSKILIATAEAEIFFGVDADLVMGSAAIPPAGGKVCFQAPGHGMIDCVAWGSYSGPSSGVGIPFRAGEGIPSGAAMERSLKGNGTLEAGDDTNDSAVDFRFGLPAPRNNGGGAGGAPGGALSFHGNLLVPEADEVHLVPVQRLGLNEDPVTVNYLALGGSATDGLDYHAVEGTLQWPNGDNDDASFNVEIIDDADPEGPETILMRIRSPVGGAVLGPIPDATITIEANDDTGPPTSRITKPKHRKRYPAKKVRRLTGSASDPEVGIALVQIALQQRLGKGCRWWNGRKFVKRACSSPRWVGAKGGASWSYRLSKLLPSSTGTIKRYELRSRARDEAGNLEASFKRGRNRNRFEVR
ncbi:MAG TPA: Calx-beta domain-containing protein [Actinomycetota bacterium]